MGIVYCPTCGHGYEISTVHACPGFRKKHVPMKEKKMKMVGTPIELDLSDEAFMILAKMAHEQDITFNQLVNNILRKWMDKIGAADQGSPACGYEVEDPFQKPTAGFLP